MALPSKEEIKAYTGKPKKILSIGPYDYGIAMIGESYFICLQKWGDINWLIKEEEFLDFDSAKQQIKQIEKEHYDAIKFKADCKVY